MSITGKWQLPYPELDNPADVPLWMEDLANRVDLLLVSFDSGNEADLPTSEKEGRFFYATDTDRLWYDTGNGWIQVNATIGVVTREMLAPDLKPSFTATPEEEAIRALGRGNDMAASGGDTRFPTDDQKAALAGTSGAPADGNRYVTTLDSRLPTANQKAALAGTAGTPSDTNRYVTDQDGRLGSRVPVSTIPPNPTPWQEIILIADAANHILWRLIWDGTAWAFLGGPPMSVFSSGGVSGQGNSMQNYTTAGPTLTCPFAGFYAVRVGGRYAAAPTAGDGRISYSIGGAGAGDGDAAYASPIRGTGSEETSNKRLKTLAAGTALVPKARTSESDDQVDSQFKNIWLEILPVYLADV